MTKHKHVWTALYWHFGPYGDQGVHVHSCMDRRCTHVYIGIGRECGQDHLELHWEKKL